jgi:hypothetical protein
MKSVSFAILIFLIGCNHPLNQNKVPDESNNAKVLYKNDLYKFSLRIPASYEYTEKIPNSVLTIVRSQKNGPDGVNLTLGINNAKGTLEDYYKFNKSILIREMPEARIVLEKKARISHYYCYETDIEFLKNNDLMHCRLYTFLESGKGFHFSLISRLKGFERAKDDFTSVLETLIIE